MFLLFLFGYLCGSVPFGLIFSKLFAGIDIREHGSGNIGSTNVLRIAGKKLAALTLVFDIIKGIVPLIVTDYFGYHNLLQAVALVTIIGHICSIWLGFKGGKGVATGIGLLLYIAPQIGIIVILTWILVFGITKISSLAAIISCIIAPIAAIFLNESTNFYLPLFCFMLSTIIICKHKDNIVRLIKGEEKPFKKA